AHAAPSTGPANPGAEIDYNLFLQCVHCGLCTASCPTYAELGNENDGPRGRIYLMRAVTDARLEPSPEVRRHLELCLDCRACKTGCPPGVHSGRLTEPFPVGRAQAGESPAAKRDWFQRRFLFGLFPYPRRMARMLWPVRTAQRTGALWLAQHLGLLHLLPAR